MKTIIEYLVNNHVKGKDKYRNPNWASWEWAKRALPAYQNDEFHKFVASKYGDNSVDSYIQLIKDYYEDYLDISSPNKNAEKEAKQKIDYLIKNRADYSTKYFPPFEQGFISYIYDNCIYEYWHLHKTVNEYLINANSNRKNSKNISSYNDLMPGDYVRLEWNNGKNSCIGKVKTVKTHKDQNKTQVILYFTINAAFQKDEKIIYLNVHSGGSKNITYNTPTMSEIDLLNEVDTTLENEHEYGKEHKSSELYGYINSDNTIRRGL